VSDVQASARKIELLEAAYAYALEHGLTDLSLRPLATAIGSSPRVLLFLFGSKDELIRALLARARTDELDLLEASSGSDLAEVTRRIWAWVAVPERRSLLTLWVEAYGRSLTDPHGPWAGFAADTVRDWLGLLAAVQPAVDRDTTAGQAQRSLALAVLRGATLDLLATGDVDRTTAVVESVTAQWR
jgi:AcrR family transcriptional regulator